MRTVYIDERRTSCASGFRFGYVLARGTLCEANLGETVSPAVQGGGAESVHIVVPQKRGRRARG